MDSLISILTTAGYVALCILLFSFSIAIHEFGHFIVALKLGYRVERFSIGFGPAIWKRTIRGVEYRFSWIPLGGYVLIPDVDPEGTKTLEGGSPGDKKGAPPAPKKEMPPWKDLLVAVAGPAMNIVLAVVLAVVLSLVPQARFGTHPAVVDGILEGSAAEKGGMMEGDVVVSVGGRAVASWSEMTSEVQFAAGRETEFVVRRGGEEVALAITPEVKENGVAYIGAVQLRNKGDESYAMWMPARGAWDQLKWDAGAVFRALKGLVTPKEMKATGNALGGPVLLAKATYSTIRHDTWDGIGFLRFVNTNLAVMNLLPIPVLDGGLILFSLIAILCRRRIPEKVTAPVTTVFMYLLIGLMLFLVGRDFWRMGTLSRPVDPGKMRDGGRALCPQSADGDGADGALRATRPTNGDDGRAACPQAADGDGADGALRATRPTNEDGQDEAGSLVPMSQPAQPSSISRPSQTSKLPNAQTPSDGADGALRATSPTTEDSDAE